MAENMEAKKENKRHRRNFILVCLIAGMIGGCAGGLGCYLHNLLDGAQGVREAIVYLELNIASVFRLLTFAVACLMFGLGVHFYHKAKNGYAMWDGETESVIEQVEKNLSMGTILSSMNYIVMLICFGFGTYQMVKAEDATGGFLLMLYAVLFMGCIFLNVAMQKACIELEKKINPEKKGSIYDFKFRKKWMASCDEAEKRAIYEAAYHSFLNVHVACSILFLILMISGMFFEVGLLPHVAVAVIWLVNLVTYFVNCMKSNAHMGC